jgi:adenosylcobinamide-GDP ribazoletransferase
VLARLRAAPGVLGVVGAASLALGKIAAAAALHPAARTPALLVTPMLGAWAMVVQCYGGTPRQARGRAAALVGRARFREFAWASLTAMGVTLAVGQALGLGLVVVAALTTLGVRVLAHRRVGGLTGRLLAATGELVETAVLVTLGTLSVLAS